MIRKLIKWIEPGLIPFSLAGAFAVFILIYRSLGLPSPVEVINLARNLFHEFGFIVLIIAAFLEGIFMISFYFPGSFVILIAVLISDMSPVSLISIGFFSWIGFIISVFVNYYMGMYGYYRALVFLGKSDTIEKMDAWLAKYGRWTIFFSAFHPNFLAASIVSNGIAKKSLTSTMLIAGSSLIFWILMWITVATPFLEEIDVEDPNTSWYIVLFLIGWGLVLLIYKNILPRIRSKVVDYR